MAEDTSSEVICVWKENQALLRAARWLLNTIAFKLKLSHRSFRRCRGQRALAVKRHPDSATLVKESITPGLAFGFGGLVYCPHSSMEARRQALDKWPELHPDPQAEALAWNELLKPQSPIPVTHFLHQGCTFDPFNQCFSLVTNI